MSTPNSVGLRGLGRTAAVALLFSAASASAGCGSPPPPKELVEARASYDRAAGGIAVKLAPAALDTAKQALQRAERSFRDAEDSQDTRALAYIADRRARLAEAVADMEAAIREKLKAEADFKTEQALALERMRQGAEKGRRDLEAERLAREAADRARAEAEKGKSEAEKARLAAERARLDAERARLEAERAKEELEKKYAAALASLKELASVKEDKRGVVITLSGAVLFATGKSELLTIAREKLTDVAKVLKEQGSPPLRIEGHTDSVGSAEENRKLSLARADAVKSHMVSSGYPADKIRTVGLGPDRPVADNTSPEGRANNRRVEIVVNPRD